MKRSASILYPLQVLTLSLLAVAFSACDNNSVGPNVGPGNEMAAKINGTEVNFTVEPIFAAYDATTKYGTFAGTTSGTPSRTLTIGFTYDIDAGTFPKTFKDPDISITYVEFSPTDSTTAICEALQGNCTLTLTRSDGDVVDGTFSATLTDSKDAGSTVTIAGGTFSAKLR